MTEETSAASTDVFINCPFDDGYKPTFDAIVFVIMWCGFRARSGLELDDSSQTRIEKLYTIIDSCRFGVHDLSRTQLDADTNLPRFNMPLELGIFLGAKRFGDERQKLKRCLVLDESKHRYQSFISDLAGMDIQAHGNDTGRAMVCVRNWLANASSRALPGTALLTSSYSSFLAEMPAIASRAGFGVDEIPYVEYQQLLAAWLLQQPANVPARRKRKSN